MAGWDDGYVTDITYTSNFFRETTPAWLAMTALLMGHRPPDLTRPFRYADFGCGHGLTATVVAASCPQAEVWGFDFNPAHIESARELAARAGLTNVRFREISFADLASLPINALPDFDFIVSHGVLSWVSPKNQRHLVATIGQRLRPGGLVYLSYNVATGWGAMPPLRTLMRLLMLSGQLRSDQAASGVLDYLDRMKQADAQFFIANPGLEQRLGEIREQDPRYIAHEFLNQDWHPLMFADMAKSMAGEKCAYIGSATLTENIDVVSVPQTMTDLIRSAPDVVLRETVRDFAAAKGFRRDIFRRGILPLAAAEHARLVDTLELEWLGQTVDEPIRLTTPMGTVAGLAELYEPLVEMFRAGSCTIGAIRSHATFAGRPLADLLQACALMIVSGYLHPAMPLVVQVAARAGTGRLNAAIGEVGASGGEIGQLVSPVIGSAVRSDLLETLMVREKASGRPMDSDGLTERLLAVFDQTGRLVQRDGKPAEDLFQGRAFMQGSVTALLEHRIPTLARLGII